jgi:hypothetical protein
MSAVCCTIQQWRQQNAGDIQCSAATVTVCSSNGNTSTLIFLHKVSLLQTTMLVRS